jgi:ABC-type branched-subunit amino acid transport system substrate-binding protein
MCLMFTIRTLAGGLAMRGTEGARRRGAPYLVLIGIAVGSLLTGLVVPFVGDGSGRDDAGELAVGEGDGLDLGPNGGVDPATGEPGAEGGGGPGDPTGAQTDGTGGPGGSGGADGSVGGDGGAGLTATEVGVSASEVKVGFLLLDTGSLSRIGIAVPGVDPVQQRAAFEAQLKDINARGGLHGRKVVGVYENFDVLSQDDMRRACLEIRDKKVFAVVAAGGYQGPAILCVTEEGKTPLINQGGHGTPTEYVQRSQGRLISMYPHSDRLMANWVAELDRQGVLKGKRIGIVSQEHTNPGDTVVGGGLIPALKRFGYTPVHHASFSADQAAAAGQVPVQVQQMSSKNVDLVMLTSSTILSTQFVQTADSQLFRPRYTFTDWASMNSDTSNMNMPASYDGTLMITTYRTGEDKTGVGETPPEKECRAVYERGTGKKLAAKGQNEHGLTQGNCTLLKVLELGAKKAGPTLTRAAFSAGVQALGPVPMTMWGGGSFAPGKYDAADYIRTAKWYSSCRCLKPVSNEFRKSRF